MEIADARLAIMEADSRDLDDRAERLVELSALLPEEFVGTSGEAADLLFSDIKATWIYGYFAATIVAAAAFCVQQLAGMLRLRVASDPTLPSTTSSLEEMAALAHEHGLVDVELRTRLVILHDAARVYSTAGLQEYERSAETRALEADRFLEHDSLLEDARAAVRCAMSVLIR